jgi:hypothetical protein
LIKRSWKETRRDEVAGARGAQAVARDAQVGAPQREHRALEGRDDVVLGDVPAVVREERADGGPPEGQNFNFSEKFTVFICSYFSVF